MIQSVLKIILPYHYFRLCCVQLLELFCHRWMNRVNRVNNLIPTFCWKVVSITVRSFTFGWVIFTFRVRSYLNFTQLLSATETITGSQGFPVVGTEHSYMHLPKINTDENPLKMANKNPECSVGMESWFIATGLILNRSTSFCDILLQRHAYPLQPFKNFNKLQFSTFEGECFWTVRAGIFALLLKLYLDLIILEPASNA